MFKIGKTSQIDLGFPSKRCCGSKLCELSVSIVEPRYYRIMKSGPLENKSTVNIKVPTEVKISQAVSLKNMLGIDEKMQTFYNIVHSLNN